MAQGDLLAFLLCAVALAAFFLVGRRLDLHLFACRDARCVGCNDAGMPSDDDFQDAKRRRRGNANRPRTNCGKASCKDSCPTQTLYERTFSGQTTTCRTCGKRYPLVRKPPGAGAGDPPKVPKPTPKAKATSAQEKELEKLRRQVKELESAAKAKEDDVPLEEPAQQTVAEAPKELVAALDHQKAVITELKGLGPILRASYPGGFDEAIAKAEGEKKRITDEIRKSKPLDVQTIAAKAKVESLDKSLSKAKKAQEKKEADMVSAQQALEAAQVEVAKQRSTIQAIEAELAEAKQRQSALDEQIKGRDGPIDCDVKTPNANLNDQERGDYEFLRSIISQKLMQVISPADDINHRIKSIVAGCTIASPQVPDQVMAEASCAEEAEDLCSEDEDTEGRSKKVAKLAEKIASKRAARAEASKSNGVSRTIGKKQM